MGIDWQNGNWAKSCDFKGNGFKNFQCRVDECSNTCLKTTICTHYTLTNYNSGTCWLKSCQVTKDDALNTLDPNMVCGIVTNIITTLRPTGGKFFWIL